MKTLFGSSKKAPGPTVTRKQSLDAVPMCNPGLEQEEGLDGRLNLTVQLKRGSGLLARFQPPVMRRQVKLDEVGTFVFRLIDGHRSTRDIIAAFASQYRVNRREAELSCVAFLKSLVTRQVVSIIIR